MDRRIFLMGAGGLVMGRNFDIRRAPPTHSTEQRLKVLEQEVARLSNAGNNPGNTSNGFAYGRILDRQTGVLDVANTAAETTLYTFTTQPNTLYNNRSVRLEMYGDALNNTGGNENIQFRTKLGATTILTPAVFTMGTNALRQVWKWVILLSADNSLAAQQAYWGFNPNAGVTDVFGTATEDALQPLPITVTVDWQTASANLSWRRQFASLELL
jgi:hypothetical protein